MPATSIYIEEAKPTVRLKNKDGDYKETQEAAVFKARGGRGHDLLDEERWYNSQPLDKTLMFYNPDMVKETCSPLMGPDFESCYIWDPMLNGSTTIRFVTPRHLVFKLNARACQSEESKLGDLSKKARDKLGMTASKRITMKSDIQGVYVGVSATTCLPVVLRWSEFWDERSMSNDDVDELHDLVVDWCGRTNTKDIIWTENMLIPGNIAYLKSAVADRLCAEEKRRFLQMMKRENSLLEAGLNPAGVAKRLPSSELTKRKPSIRRLTQDGQEYDSLHFKLQWPPMAALEFPREMISAMERFLSHHPHDNIPMNIALAATIIYIDLVVEGWLPEGFTNGLSITPLPPLAQFVLYFPHMLRFVEIKHLTEFIHPGRFAAGHYANDKQLSASSFSIHSHMISLEQMRVWYSQIRSRYPNVSKSFRFRLIPASMPGTQMVFPRHCTNAEPPSIDLFRMCCLNDIRTLGLPSYHHSPSVDEAHRLFRYVAGPDVLFSNHLCRTVADSFHTRGLVGEDYWRPKSDTTCMALTRQAMKIDMLFPDVSSDYYVDNKAIAKFVKRHYFDNVAYYTQDYDYCGHNSEYDREKRSARAKDLYSVATYLKIPIDKLWQCPDTGCPAWNGMETQLQQLKEKGLLKLITSNDKRIPANDEEPERAAKRPRLSEPTKTTLSVASKTRIQGLMSSTTALSRDWDAFNLHVLESEPTIQEARRLLSQVHPFILSLEELPRTISDDGDNGKGNLEDVLRLAYKAVGLDPQLAFARQDKNRASQLSAFSQFGQSIEQAVEGFIDLKSIKNGYSHALRAIVALANSPLVQDQIKIYKEIDALLKE